MAQWQKARRRSQTFILANKTIQKKNRYSNGDTYEGQWLKGKKHGDGAMTFINGAKYQGGYKEDKKHFLGTYTHADGVCV